MHLINEYCVYSKHNGVQIMHNLWVFYQFFQKSRFAENYFLIAAMNLTTRGPQYTCLVFNVIFCNISYFLLNRNNTYFQIRIILNLLFTMHGQSTLIIKSRCLKLKLSEIRILQNLGMDIGGNCQQLLIIIFSKLTVIGAFYDIVLNVTHHYSLD